MRFAWLAARVDASSIDESAAAENKCGMLSLMVSMLRVWTPRARGNWAVMMSAPTRTHHGISQRRSRRSFKVVGRGTPIPVMNPVITGAGVSLTTPPSFRAPVVICMAPQHMVAIAKPARPWSLTALATSCNDNNKCQH